MSNKTILEQLITEWDDEWAQGHDLSPAEVCRDYPELAAELGRRIRTVRQLDRLCGMDVKPGPDDLPRRVGGRLERLARNMPRDFPNVLYAVDPGDVLQGSLMRLLRTLRATRPEGTRHSANLAALHIRRALLDFVRHFLKLLDWARGAADSQDGEAAEPLAPRSVADDLDLWSAFHEQVDRLPEEEREVVSLRFYHGWTQARIAELLGVDERTIRRWWCSAAVKLSKALGGQLPEP